MSEDDDSRPVGFLGRIRRMKAITWLLIVGLVGLAIGGTSIIFTLQSLG
ncbi:MAG: hypothetical protein LH471_01640 [Salinibacterium sp.]|nr:hypothetical protein [Salinibacterium sp.]